MTARGLAVRALLHQEQNGYANLVLDGELKKCTPPLEARDAAFCASIFYTVLERQNLLDCILARYCRQPIERLDAPVRAILRAGLAQALYLKVPVSAAVNEAVKLTKAYKKTSAAGMVNAVLRRAAVFDPAQLSWQTVAERISVQCSLSPAITALLCEQYGEQALPLAEAFYLRPQTLIRVNTLKTDSAALAELLKRENCTVADGPWPDSLTVHFPASPAQTAAFQTGFFHVQGAPSQLAALSLCARPGQRVLDLCAAPGGKTLTLAQQMENHGELLSCDAVRSRLSLIEKNLLRCGVRCAVVRCNDAALYDPALGVFDRVLCDVPCSGLGLIAKKPDIRYKNLENIAALYELQANILRNGARYLAQKGRLVYSTCTVNRCENEAQVAAFLQEHPDFRTVPPVFTPKGAEPGEYGMLLLPHKTGMDGFFIAVLERK